MHMADALISPAVGGAMWAVTAGTITYCSRKVREELDDRKVPLMGVLGAFLFTAQMINFTIPGTGSSGHLGGGLLLAILLGPHAAFLTIASVLVVQALFFADGGLLALGCNIFNLGVFPAFIAYPLIYRNMVGTNPSRIRLTGAAIVAAVAGLQMGAFGVVLETLISSISSLPFSTFVAFMQPIHLAIGIVEGVVTATIVSFVSQARPDIVAATVTAQPLASRSLRTVVLAFLAVALLTGGVVSRFASVDPDGLEWAITKVAGDEELKGAEQGIHTTLAAFQEKLAILPEYSFKKSAAGSADGQNEAVLNHNADEKLGTSVSGIVGGMVTLVLVFMVGIVVKRLTCPA